MPMFDTSAAASLQGKTNQRDFEAQRRRTSVAPTNSGSGASRQRWMEEASKHRTATVRSCIRVHCVMQAGCQWPSGSTRARARQAYTHRRAWRELMQAQRRPEHQGLRDSCVLCATRCIIAHPPTQPTRALVRHRLACLNRRQLHRLKSANAERYCRSLI